MDSDSDSFYEKTSENEHEFAVPLNIRVNVNLDSPESSPPTFPVTGSRSTCANSCCNLCPVWELRDDGTNFLNYYNRADALELQNWATETRARMGEKGFVVEAPLV